MANLYSAHMLSATLLLLSAAVMLSTGLCCKQSHWEPRLDADLSHFEAHGISHSDVEYAATQVCGGFIVSIVNNELYAMPLGWEANPKIMQHRQMNPHNLVTIFTKAMCEYRIPDVTFVVNAYDKLCMHDYRRPVPVFSWGKDTINNDYQVLMPYGTVFLGLNKTVRNQHAGPPPPPWNERREVGIWRGTTTGGTFKVQNWEYYPRTRLVRQCNSSRLCDAKFTGFPQSHRGAELAMRAMGFHGDAINLADFLKYKYIIVNDGNMAPSSRLSIFMQSGSLILKQESPSIEFFYDDLQPYIHYVPLSYNHGDVERKIIWAQEHDKLAKNIAKHAMTYAKTYFTAHHLNCYMYRLLLRYSRAQRFSPGFHNSSYFHVPKQCTQPLYS